VRIALANHPGLAAARDRYEAARQAVPQAQALPDPRVMIEAVRTRTGPEETEMWFRQTFPWPGKLRLRGEVARHEAEAMRAEYQAKLLDVALEAGSAFHDYAYHGRAIDLTRRILGLAERLEATLEERVRAGGDLASLLRLQVEIGKNRDALQSLEKRAVAAGARLRAAMGRNDSALLPFPELRDTMAPTESRDHLLAAQRALHPDLVALAERLRGAEEGVALARRTPWPDPSLGVARFDVPHADENPYALELEFSLPLRIKRNRALRDEAEARRDALAAARTERENQLVAELEGALQQVEETTTRMTLYQETLLPRARQALEVTETAYRAGNATVLEFIDSQRTLLELEQAYWRAVADRHIGALRLRVLTGRELP
jgi:outer membrane protein TolC